MKFIKAENIETHKIKVFLNSSQAAKALNSNVCYNAIYPYIDSDHRIFNGIWKLSTFEYDICEELEEKFNKKN